MIRLILFAFCIISFSSCYIGMTTDEIRQRNRIKESERMFKETHRVRKKCSPRRGRPRRSHRKRFYS